MRGEKDRERAAANCPFVVLLNSCAGSGKTTLAWGLAAVLGERAPVGLLDLAPDRCLSRMVSDCLVRPSVRPVVQAAGPLGPLDTVCRRLAAGTRCVLVDTGSRFDFSESDVLNRASIVVVPTSADDESVRHAVAVGRQAAGQKISVVAVLTRMLEGDDGLGARRRLSAAGIPVLAAECRARVAFGCARMFGASPYHLARTEMVEALTGEERADVEAAGADLVAIASEIEGRIQRHHA